MIATDKDKVYLRAKVKKNLKDFNGTTEKWNKQLADYTTRALFARLARRRLRLGERIPSPKMDRRKGVSLQPQI